MNSQKQQLNIIKFNQPKNAYIRETLQKRPAVLINHNSTRVVFASTSRKCYAMCLKKYNDSTPKTKYYDEQDYWAVYLAHMSCAISCKKKQFFYIEKCLKCFISQPSLAAIHEYNELVKKSNLNKEIDFNDFYSVTKQIKIQVLKYATSY